MTSKIKISYLLIIPCLMLLACRKDIVAHTPNDGQTASVNFYGASSSFPLYPTVNRVYGGVGLFLNTAPYTATINNSTGAAVPFFSFDGTAKLAKYPNLNTDAGALLYMDYASGKQALHFTYMIATSVQLPVNTPVADLLDTTVNLTAQSHSIIYFTDAPAAEGAKAVYRMVQADEPLQKAVDSKMVSVRLIHLSADAGSARVVLVKPDGSEITAALPQSLTYGNYNDYTRLDTAGNVQFGQLLLRIYLPGSSTPLVAGVPANPGHSYEVLLTGLASAHGRQIISAVDAANKPIYQTVTLPAGLGTTIRQTY